MTNIESVVVKKNIESESTENRIQGLDKFYKFIDKLGLKQTNPQDIILLIKKTNPNKFIDIISFGNSFLRNLSKALHFKSQKRGKVVVFISSNKYKLYFKKFYSSMKTNIDINNYKMWSLKLSLTILIFQIFKNGNGRTARNIFCLMNNLKLNENKENSYNYRHAVENIYKNAIANLFKKKLNIDDLYQNGKKYFVIDNKNTDLVIRSSESILLFFVTYQKIHLPKEKITSNQKDIYIDITHLDNHIKNRIYQDYLKLTDELFWITNQYLHENWEIYYKKLVEILTK